MDLAISVKKMRTTLILLLLLLLLEGYECFSSSSSSTSTAGGKNSFSNEKLKASLNRPKVSRDHLHHQQEKAAILVGATNTSTSNTTAGEKIINEMPLKASTYDDDDDISDHHYLSTTSTLALNDEDKEEDLQYESVMLSKLVRNYATFLEKTKNYTTTSSSITSTTSDKGEPDKLMVNNNKAAQGEEAGRRKSRPNIIENDIATDMEENLFRLGLRWDVFPHKKWSNNTIYYIINAKDYAQREQQLIKSAIQSFQFLSCLKFKTWDGDPDKDYLHFQNSKARPGCWSYIGKRGGEQILSLRPPDEKSCHCLCNVGRVLHEMMHALGFYHEHTRPDRDNYIEIIEENVKRGKNKNFQKKTLDTTTVDFDYDYNSIMHYGPLFFSKDKRSKKTTIVPLSQSAKIGQRNMLSKTDCMKVNQAFGCFDPMKDWNNKKIQILCGLLGY